MKFKIENGLNPGVTYLDVISSLSTFDSEDDFRSGSFVLT